MVETITPVVHGGRRGRWAVSVTLHVLGAAISAAAFGALLGAVGGVLAAPWGRAGIVVVAIAALAYVAREAFGLRVPVPQLRRQVPDWWRTFFGPGVSSLLYGLGLGVGFATYLLHGTLVVVSTAALASGRPLVGAVVMAPFGVARAATVLVARGASTADASGALVGRVATASSWRGWRVAHVAVTAAVAVVAVAAARDAAWRLEDLGAVGGAVVAVAFGIAAIGKVVGRRRWTRVVAAYGVPGRRAVAVAVPVLEAAVALSAFVGAFRVAGLGALGLLGVFSVAIVVARIRRGPRLECGCFGGVRARDYRVLLVRNVLLAVAACVAVRWAPSGGALGSWRAPTSAEIVPAVLVVAGVAVIVAVLAVTATSIRRREVRA